MSSGSSKDFGPIQGDYAFFEQHATEADEDVRSYAPLVHAQIAGTGPVRMLDYGCGGGRFSTRFLQMANITPDRLQLSLIEPVEAYRTAAASQLRSYSSLPIDAAPALSPGAGPYDLILANHVFYYVKQLDEQLAAILAALAPRGLFLAAMAGQDNTLIQFWNRCFAMIGMQVPFYTAEDFQAALDVERIAFRKQTVSYRLAFADGEDNRQRILRFLLGDYFARMPRSEMLQLFDLYAEQGRIDMPVMHEQFIVRGP